MKKMRRICSILLAFCMIMSLAMVPAMAVEPIVFDALDDVISFYDNDISESDSKYVGVQNIEEGPVQNSGNLVLRPAGEWVAYDISTLQEGTYSVEVEYYTNGVTKNRAGLDFIVDGGLETRFTISTDTASWTASATASAGNVYIPAGAEELKVKNFGYNNISLKTVSLTYVGSDDTSDDIVIYSPSVSVVPKADLTGATATKSTDYYNDGGNFSNMQEKSGVIKMDNVADWTRYDISDFKEGTYEVTLNRGHGASALYSLSIDEEVALSPVTLASTGSASTAQDAVLGNIYISEDSEYLKLLYGSSSGSYVYHLKFKYISSGKPAVTFNGTGVISNVHGVGFYDAGGAETLEKQTDTTAILRKNDWLKYDVSGLDAGTYELKINNSTNSVPKIKIDVDDAGYIVTDTANTGSYSTYQDYSFGKIYIGEDTQTIKVTNVSAGDFSMFVAKIILQPETEENTAEMSININPQSTSERSVSNATNEGTYVILRQGGWLRYDISSYGITPGIYSLRAKVNTLGAVALGVEAEGTGKLRSTPITGAAASSTEIEIGKLIIGENSTYFTVSHNDNADRALLYALE